jgi:hypothetical protein
MFNKIASIAAATTFSLISASALAELETSDHTIDFQAQVPSDDFSVVPVLASTTTKTQIIKYHTGRKEFDDYKADFTVKSTAAVHAKLARSAILFNGELQMPLEVKFNDVSLATDSKEVVTKINAAAAKNYTLVVAQTGTMPIAGRYQGPVELIFESTLP